MRFGVCGPTAEVIAHGRTVLSSGPPDFTHTAELKGVANTPILKPYFITWIIWMKSNFLCVPFSLTCCSYSEEVSWCQIKETFCRSGAWFTNSVLDSGRKTLISQTSRQTHHSNCEYSVCPRQVEMAWAPHLCKLPRAAGWALRFHCQ